MLLLQLLRFQLVRLLISNVLPKKAIPLLIGEGSVHSKKLRAHLQEIAPFLQNDAASPLLPAMAGTYQYQLHIDSQARSANPAATRARLTITSTDVIAY